MPTIHLALRDILGHTKYEREMSVPTALIGREEAVVNDSVRCVGGGVLRERDKLAKGFSLIVFGEDGRVPVSWKNGPDTKGKSVQASQAPAIPKHS